MQKTISIRAGLMAIVILAAALMAGLIGLGYFAQTARDANDRTEAYLDQLQGKITAIESALLRGEGAQKDFQIHYHEEDVGHFNAMMLEIKAQAKAAKDLMAASPEQAENIALLEKLVASTAVYKEKFEAVVASARVLGFSRDEGLSGALHTSAEAVLAALQGAANPAEGKALFLAMRQREAAFVLSDDPAEIAAVDALVQDFNRLPLPVYASFDLKREVEGLVAQYQAALQAYAAERANQITARAEMQAEANLEVPLLQDIKANFDAARIDMVAEMRAAQAQKQNISLAIGGLGIAVFAVLTLWLSLLIVRPLSAIGTALEQMRAGNFDAPLRPSRIRETAMISAAFSDFRKDIALRQSIEQDLAEVISACAMGDFSRRITLAEGQVDSSGMVAGVNAIGEAAQKGIGDVLQVIEALAQGDLTKSMSKDHNGVFLRIATSVEQLVDNLTQIVSEMTQTSQNLDHTSQQIVGASHIASQRGQTSAASLEETAAALQQLSGTVKDTASSAGAAENFVSGAQSQTDEAYRLAGEAGAAIERIRDSSKAIASVVDLIEDVAFQTNLLALNAGVEAARAGDAGRGFAVVASEVRELAQRVTESAREINRLVRGSEKDVGDGVDLVVKSAQSLSSIRDLMGNIVSRVGEIAQNTEGQANGITEINIAVTALDRDVQTNVASLDETVHAGEALRGEAERLTALVGRFRLAPRDGAFDGTTSAQARALHVAAA